jgi:hypothetical protein
VPLCKSLFCGIDAAVTNFYCTFLQHKLKVNSDSLSYKEETFQKLHPTPFFRGEICPQDRAIRPQNSITSSCAMEGVVTNV